MTGQEFFQLQEGSIIATKAGTLRRVMGVKDWKNCRGTTRCITLLKVDCSGNTVYVLGDKYLFEIIKI